MSKLSEAIDKAKREALTGRGPVEAQSPVSATATAAVESATILPLPRQRAPRPSPPPVREAARERVEFPDPHGAPEEHMVSLVSPHSHEAERFRALRHLVEQCHRDAGLRVVAVSSATEGDGKSLVAVNLAGALAQNRAARVLLLDGDLRAPSIPSLVGIRSAPRGVSELVEGATLDLSDVLVVRPSYNLSVLAAGAAPASAYEVLKSHRFAEIIAEARSTFDYVVIDTPPVLIFPDARVIDEHVDAFLLVVRADKTPRKLVDEAAMQLGEEKLLGLVFNWEGGSQRYRYPDRRSYGRQGWWSRWRR